MSKAKSPVIKKEISSGEAICPVCKHEPVSGLHYGIRCGSRCTVKFRRIYHKPYVCPKGGSCTELLRGLPTCMPCRMKHFLKSGLCIPGPVIPKKVALSNEKQTQKTIPAKGRASMTKKRPDPLPGVARSSGTKTTTAPVKTNRPNKVSLSKNWITIDDSAGTSAPASSEKKKTSSRKRPTADQASELAGNSVDVKEENTVQGPQTPVSKRKNQRSKKVAGGKTNEVAVSAMSATEPMKVEVIVALPITEEPKTKNQRPKKGAAIKTNETADNVTSRRESVDVVKDDTSLGPPRTPAPKPKNRRSKKGAIVNTNDSVGTCNVSSSGVLLDVGGDVALPSPQTRVPRSKNQRSKTSVAGKTNDVDSATSTIDSGESIVSLPSTQAQVSKTKNQRSRKGAVSKVNETVCRETSASDLVDVGGTSAIDSGESIVSLPNTQAQVSKTKNQRSRKSAVSKVNETVGRETSAIDLVDVGSPSVLQSIPTRVTRNKNPRSRKDRDIDADGLQESEKALTKSAEGNASAKSQNESSESLSETTSIEFDNVTNSAKTNDEHSENLPDEVPKTENKRNKGKNRRSDSKDDKTLTNSDEGRQETVKRPASVTRSRTSRSVSSDTSRVAGGEDLSSSPVIDITVARRSRKSSSTRSNESSKIIESNKDELVSSSSADVGDATVNSAANSLRQRLVESEAEIVSEEGALNTSAETVDNMSKRPLNVKQRNKRNKSKSIVESENKEMLDSTNELNTSSSVEIGARPVIRPKRGSETKATKRRSNSASNTLRRRSKDGIASTSEEIVSSENVSSSSTGTDDSATKRPARSTTIKKAHKRPKSAVQSENENVLLNESGLGNSSLDVEEIHNVTAKNQISECLADKFVDDNLPIDYVRDVLKDKDSSDNEDLSGNSKVLLSDQHAVVVKDSVASGKARRASKERVVQPVEAQLEPDLPITLRKSGRSSSQSSQNALEKDPKELSKTVLEPEKCPCCKISPVNGVNYGVKSCNRCRKRYFDLRKSFGRLQCSKNENCTTEVNGFILCRVCLYFKMLEWGFPKVADQPEATLSTVMQSVESENVPSCPTSISVPEVLTTDDEKSICTCCGSAEKRIKKSFGVLLCGRCRYQYSLAKKKESIICSGNENCTEKVNGLIVCKACLVDQLIQSGLPSFDFTKINRGKVKIESTSSAEKGMTASGKASVVEKETVQLEKRSATAKLPASGKRAFKEKEVVLEGEPGRSTDRADNTPDENVECETRSAPAPARQTVKLANLRKKCAVCNITSIDCIICGVSCCSFCKMKFLKLSKMVSLTCSRNATCQKKIRGLSACRRCCMEHMISVGLQKPARTRSNQATSASHRNGSLDRPKPSLPSQNASNSPLGPGVTSDSSIEVLEVVPFDRNTRRRISYLNQPPIPAPPPGFKTPARAVPIEKSLWQSFGKSQVASSTCEIPFHPEMLLENVTDFCNTPDLRQSMAVLGDLFMDDESFSSLEDTLNDASDMSSPSKRDFSSMVLLLKGQSPISPKEPPKTVSSLGCSAEPTRIKPIAECLVEAPEPHDDLPSPSLTHSPGCFDYMEAIDSEGIQELAETLDLLSEADSQNVMEEDRPGLSVSKKNKQREKILFRPSPNPAETIQVALGNTFQKAKHKNKVSFPLAFDEESVTITEAKSVGDDLKKRATHSLETEKTEEQTEFVSQKGIDGFEKQTEFASDKGIDSFEKEKLTESLKKIVKSYYEKHKDSSSKYETMMASESLLKKSEKRKKKSDPTGSLERKEAETKSLTKHARKRKATAGNKLDDSDELDTRASTSFSSLLDCSQTESETGSVSLKKKKRKSELPSLGKDTSTSKSAKMAGGQTTRKRKDISDKEKVISPLRVMVSEMIGTSSPKEKDGKGCKSKSKEMATTSSVRVSTEVRDSTGRPKKRKLEGEMTKSVLKEITTPGKEDIISPSENKRLKSTHHSTLETPINKDSQSVSRTSAKEVKQKKKSEMDKSASGSPRKNLSEIDSSSSASPRKNVSEMDESAFGSPRKIPSEFDRSASGSPRSRKNVSETSGSPRKKLSLHPDTKQKLFTDDIKIQIRSDPRGKSEHKRSVIVKEKTTQKKMMEIDPNVIEADSSTILSTADDQKPLTSERGSDRLSSLDDDRSNSPSHALVIACDEVLDYEPDVADSGNESKSGKSLFSDSESDSDTESYRKKLFTRTPQKPAMEKADDNDDAHFQTDSCEVSSSLRNDTPEDSNEGNFRKSFTPPLDEEQTLDSEKRPDDVNSIQGRRNSEVTVPATEYDKVKPKEEFGNATQPFEEKVAVDNSLPAAENAAKDSRPLCKWFMRGRCVYKNCKYKHERVQSETQQIAPPPTVPKVPEVTQEEFEETCKNGVLNKAVEMLMRLPSNFDYGAKTNMLVTFTRTALDLNQLSKLKTVGLVIEQHKIREAGFLSDLVLLCDTKKEGARDFLLQLVRFCKCYNQVLTTAAVRVIRHAFAGEEPSLFKLVLVLFYTVVTCKQTPPMNLVNRVLYMSPGQPDQGLRIFEIMSHFHEATWNQLNQEHLVQFLDVLRNDRHLAQQALILEKKILSMRMETMIHRPEQWVQNVIDGGRWSELAAQFRNFGEGQANYSMVPEIHDVLHKLGEHSAECYSHFVYAVTDDGKWTLTSRQHQVLGQIGTALMLENHHEKRFKTAFEILRTLHQYNLDYYRLQKPALTQKQVHTPQGTMITPCRAVLVAVEICLEVKEYMAAVNVFQGYDWVQPSNHLLVDASYEEILWRARLLKILAEKLFEMRDHLELGMKVLKYCLASISEDLTDENVKVGIQVIDVDKIYSDYMREAIKLEYVEEALELFEYYKKMDVMLYLSNNVLRALLILCNSCGKYSDARNMFNMFCLMGIYSVSKPLPNCKSLKVKSDLTNQEILLHIYTFFEDLCKIFYSQRKYVFEEMFTVTITISASSPSAEDEMDVLSQITPSIADARDRVVFVLEHLLDPPIKVSNSAIPDMVTLDHTDVYQHFVRNEKIYKPLAAPSLKTPSPRIKSPPILNTAKKTPPKVLRLNSTTPDPVTSFPRSLTEKLARLITSNPVLSQTLARQNKNLQKLSGVSPVNKVPPPKTATLVASASKANPTASVLLGTNSTSQPSVIPSKDLSLKIVASTKKGKRTIESPVPVASGGSGQVRRLSAPVPANANSHFNTNVQKAYTPPFPKQQVKPAESSCNSAVFNQVVEFLTRRLSLQKQCTNVDVRAKELAVMFLKGLPRLTSLDRAAMKDLNNFAIVKIVPSQCF